MAPKNKLKAMKAAASPKQVLKPAAKGKAKAGAKGKAKAKAIAVKQEPFSPSKLDDAGAEALVSRHDQQLFSTFLSRNADDPKVASLKAQYQSLARNDSKKRELIANWKLDKSLSWHVVQEDTHQTGRAQELNGAMGWVTKWQLADQLKMPVEDDLFTELLTELESSSEQWDLSKPQEAFLAKKGEVKYWLHSLDQFVSLKDWQQDSESVSKSRGATLKVKGNPSQPALMSQHPLHDQLQNIAAEISGLQSRCQSLLGKIEDGITKCIDRSTGGEEKFKQIKERALEDLKGIEQKMEELLKILPAEVTEEKVEEIKKVLRESKQHKEGLQKTLLKIKVLTED